MDRKATTDKVWTPQRTVGKLWSEAVKAIPENNKIDRGIVQRIFEQPSIAPLVEEVSPNVSPGLLATWTDCELILEIFDDLRNREMDLLSKEVRDEYRDSKRIMNDYIARLGRADWTDEFKFIVDSIKDYYDDNVSYYMHDFLDYRKFAPRMQTPVEEWNEIGLFLPLPSWMYTVEDFLSENYHPKKLGNRNRGFYNRLIPKDAHVAQMGPSFVFWLFDAYLPVHYLTVLSNVARRVFSSQEEDSVMCQYEVDLLNRVYSQRRVKVHLERIQSTHQFSAWSISRTTQVIGYINFPWNELLTVVVLEAICDFVDDLITVKECRGASREQGCVECGQFYDVDIYSRQRKYCSDRCKSRARKRRQRESKKKEEIESRRIN